MSSQDSLSKNTSTSTDEVVTPETESVLNESTQPAMDVLERAKALRSKIQ